MHVFFQFLAALGTAGVAFYALLSDYLGRLNEAYVGTLRDLTNAAASYQELAHQEMVHRVSFGDRNYVVLGSQGYLVMVRFGRARANLRPGGLDRTWPASIRYGPVIPMRIPLGRVQRALAEEVKRVYAAKDPEEPHEREKEFLLLSFLKAAQQGLALLGRSRWVRAAIAASVTATILGSVGALATIPFASH